MRKDYDILKCATRMVKKMEQSKYYTINGEFPRPVKLEIERMKNLCRNTKEDKL